MRIAEDWLREHGAYDDIIAWWREHGAIADLDELMSTLASADRFHYAQRIAEGAQWSGVFSSKSCKAYFRNGLLDRPDGPAVLWGDGVRVQIEHRRNGLLHRPDGPAVLWARKDGMLHAQGYYLDGRLVRREEVMGEEA